jgi:hypothetical protein
MARPAHPDNHDERLRNVLAEAREKEMLLPCPDLASARLIKSRCREIVRAHSAWQTGEAESYRGMRFKIHNTHLILPIRPHYAVDSTKFPYTLALDNKDVMDEILPHATATSNVTPLTRDPTRASSDVEFPEMASDEAEDDYSRIFSGYKQRT